MEIYKTIFEKIKNPLDFLKEYLNLIIIIPALLGGLWQIIELSKISFSFIRFFSVSQIIPDGLLILLVTIIMFLSFSFADFCFRGYLKIRHETFWVFKKSNKFFAILFFIFYLIILFFSLDVANNEFVDIDSFFYVFIFIAFNILLLYSAGTLWYCATTLSKDFRYLNNLFLKSGLLMVVIQIIFLISFIKCFHKSYLLPKNVANLRNINQKFHYDNPSSIMRILYFNDKYIFIEISNQIKEENRIIIESEIKIERFENLLDDAENPSHRSRKDLDRNSSVGN